MTDSLPHTAPDVVIVTTAAKLAAFVEEAVDRAVRRALAAALEKREDHRAWLPTKDAIRVYGKSRSTLHRWAKGGKIKSKKIGGSLYFSPPELAPDS